MRLQDLIIKLNRDNLLFFLILSLPISILTGPFLPDLTVSLIGIIFISKLKINDYSKILSYPFTKLFIFFYLYILFSSLISSDIIFSLHSSLFYFRFLFFVLAVSYLIDKNQYLTKSLFYLLLIIFILIFIDSLFYAFINNEEGLFTKKIEGIRWDSLVFDATLGSYVVRIMPIFLIIYLKNFIRSDLILFFFFGMFLLILFTAGERASFVMFFLYILFFPIGLDKNILNFYLKFVTFLITVCTLIFITKPALFERVFEYTFNQMVVSNKGNFFFNEFIQDLFNMKISNYKFFLFSFDHQNYIYSAIEIFKENFFFGGGPRMFRILCHGTIEQGCNTHPHNFYIQLLSETGIIGFIFLLLLFLFIFFKIIKFAYFKLIQKNLIFSNTKYLLFLSFFITLWPINTTGNFFNNLLCIIMFFPVGFYLSKKFIKI